MGQAGASAGGGLGVQQREAQPHVAGPAALVGFDLDEEYLAGEEGLLAEGERIREARLAERHRVVLPQFYVQPVKGVEAREHLEGLRGAERRGTPRTPFTLSLCHPFADEFLRSGQIAIRLTALSYSVGLNMSVSRVNDDACCHSDKMYYYTKYLHIYI